MQHCRKWSVTKRTSVVLLLFIALTNFRGFTVIAEEALPTQEAPSQSSAEVTPPATPGEQPVIIQESQNGITSGTGQEIPDDTQQVPSITPSPTPDSAVTNDTSSTETTTTSTAKTGGNTVTGEIPDIAPNNESSEKEETPSAELTRTAESSATESTPSATPVPKDHDTQNTTDHQNTDNSPGSSGAAAETTMTTGDAASVTSVTNDVNTTSINAITVHRTINVFLPQDTTIDLAEAAMKATAMAVMENGSGNETMNIGITVSNEAVTLDNELVSQALSGQSLVNGNDTDLNTGNAMSVVSLVNSVNTTVINSAIHVYTINIFSVANGNIILPELTGGASATDHCCSRVSVTNNLSDVRTTADSLAVSGENTISGSGQIITGDAKSAVNITNLVNTTLIDTSYYELFINVFGIWNGTFRGWYASPALNGITGLTAAGAVIYGDGTSCCADVKVYNGNTVLDTSVQSSAVTGKNSMHGESDRITTGNAYSAVNIVNLANSTFINSFGFFTFVNIFGTLNGDIGGESEFALDTEPTPAPIPTTASEKSETKTQTETFLPHEEGGQLIVTNTNNIGAWVLPGDTVTFFITVKNPGTGKVYDTKINLYLIDENGKVAGGRQYPVGILDINRRIKLTTGFVLSVETPPGRYIARAEAFGTVGPDNRVISASADSEVLVAGQSGSGGAWTGTEPMPRSGTPEVLGISNPKPTIRYSILWALMVLAFLLPEYFLVRKICDSMGYRKPAWTRP